MKNSWFLLLMTPLFTYANYENNGFEGEELSSRAALVEEEVALTENMGIEDYLPSVDLNEPLIAEGEVAVAPMIVKKDQKKRITPQAATASNKKAKDLRSNGNRPQVTQRDRADQKEGQTVQKRAARAQTQIADEEDSYVEEQPVRRQPAQKRAARAKTQVAEEEDSYIEEQQPVRRQPAQKKVVRSKAPVVVDEEDSYVEEQQPARRQPAQKKAVRSKAPVVDEEDSYVEEQPARRQPAQKKVVRSKTPVFEEEEFYVEEPVRRAPAQKRVARSRAPAPELEDSYAEEQPTRSKPAQKRVVRSSKAPAPELEDSHVEEQPVRRQPAQKRVVRSSKAPVVEQEESYEEQPVRRQTVQKRTTRSKASEKEEAYAEEKSTRKPAQKRANSRSKTSALEKNAGKKQGKTALQEKSRKTAARGSRPKTRLTKNWAVPARDATQLVIVEKYIDAQVADRDQESKASEGFKPMVQELQIAEQSEDLKVKKHLAKMDAPRRSVAAQSDYENIRAQRGSRVKPRHLGKRPIGD